MNSLVLGQVYREHLNTSTGRIEQKEVTETSQYVPIGENLTVFLEPPGIMSSIVSEREKSGDGSTLNSYTDGAYWKRISEGEQDITIDILIYRDDFETTNPLGSKKGQHKLLGIYILT